MTTDMFLPALGCIIRLRQVRENGVEFDLARVPSPKKKDDAVVLNQDVTVKMKVRDRVGAGARELLDPRVADVVLKPQGNKEQIDFWHESRLALAANALTGVLLPPCDWLDVWEDGQGRITHLASNQVLPWRRKLEPGDTVVLDFRTRVEGGEQKRDRNTSLCVAYVEEGPLVVEATAAFQPGAAPDPDPDFPLRTSTEIQGNILAGFNKDHQVLLFLRFKDGERARAWLEELVDPPEGCGIATTAEVTAFNDLYSAALRRGDPSLGNLKAVWVNVAFTSEGICLLQPLAKTGLEEHLKAFCEGPAKRAEILGDDDDSAPQHWVVGGSGQPDVHALLTVAGDDIAQLQEEVNRQLARAVRFGLDVRYQQRGDDLPEPASGHEHFGFKDGVSQPGVRGYTKPPVVGSLDKDQFLLGENPLKWMADGSFQVFRRLRQDVAGWRAQIAYLSEGFPPDFQMRPALLAAKLLGRWPSGTPLDRAPRRDYRPAPSLEDNDFDYDDDGEGVKTPLFAHIRRLNPREGEHDPRILRRGVPFGAVFDPDAAGAEHHAVAPRGLLFIAYMASIEAQFERLQAKFANQRAPEEPDPVVGVPREGGSCWVPRLSGEGEEPNGWQCDLRRYVWTEGTVYAFAPSLFTLRALATNDLDALGLSDSEPSRP